MLYRLMIVQYRANTMSHDRIQLASEVAWGGMCDLSAKLLDGIRCGIVALPGELLVPCAHTVLCLNLLVDIMS